MRSPPVSPTADDTPLHSAPRFPIRVFSDISPIMKTGPIKNPASLRKAGYGKNASGKKFCRTPFKNPALRNENAVIGLDGNRPVFNGKIIIRHGFSTARHLHVAGSPVRDVAGAHNCLQKRRHKTFFFIATPPLTRTMCSVSRASELCTFTRNVGAVYSSAFL